MILVLVETQNDEQTFVFVCGQDKRECGTRARAQARRGRAPKEAADATDATDCSKVRHLSKHDQV